MNRILRKLFVCGSLSFLAINTALSQNFPSKSIEWVVPYPAGGGTDVVARTLAQAMSAELKQPIIVSNKPGAATNIGADYVVRSKPDGYVILSGDTATLAANQFLYQKLSFNAEKDLSAVGLTVRFPMVLVVNPDVPAQDLKTFLAWVKTQSGPVPYATPGSGSPHHLASELFREQALLALTHVPYKGAAPAVQDVVGGQVPFMFVDTASGYQFITSGKLRPIGVASKVRLQSFPDIPTLEEQGLTNFEAAAWQGLVVPHDTPVEVINILNKALVKSLTTTEVKERLLALGLEITPSTPEQMTQFENAERKKWGAVIKASDIRVD